MQKLSKSVTFELLPAFADLACDFTGRKVLLHLLCRGNRRYFYPSDMDLLRPLQRAKLADDGTVTVRARLRGAHTRRC